jgi:peptidoglycan/LPS O-acetylase OafA/YrhL
VDDAERSFHVDGPLPGGARSGDRLAVLAAMSVVLAVLTYRFVERPFLIRKARAGATVEAPSLVRAAA